MFNGKQDPSGVGEADPVRVRRVVGSGGCGDKRLLGRVMVALVDPPQQLIACDNMRGYGIRFSRDWSLASVDGIRRVVWTRCLNHSTP